MRFILPLLAFVLFTAYSVGVTQAHGYFGFLDLANEPWGPQVLMDLVFAITVNLGFIVPDARARRINPWPYVISALALGSISVLAYFTHRGWKERQLARG